MAFDFSALNNSVEGLFGGDCKVVKTGIVIQAVFDKEYVDVFDIEASGPAITAKSGDISSISNGDKLLIETVTYTVVEQQPDSEGMTLLRLHES